MRVLIAILALAPFLSACTEIELFSHFAKKGRGGQSVGAYKVGKPYKVSGKRYYPKERYQYSQTGIASWYGPGFHGKQTANGERFDQNELTAAHPTLQMPSLVRVTNLQNGRSIVVRINDRGPFAHGRIIDVSKRSAELLGFKGQGVAKVRLDVLTQESMQIAELAKQGQSTKGMEVAYNRNSAPVRLTKPAPRTVMPTPQPAPAAPMPKVQTAQITQTPLNQPPVQGHVDNGRFMPDPVVTTQPVYKTQMYIQVASLSSSNNAYNMASQVGSRVGDARVVPVNLADGRTTYRVQVGPIDTIASADDALRRARGAGYRDAIIVVD